MNDDERGYVAPSLPMSLSKKQEIADARFRRVVAWWFTAALVVGIALIARWCGR